MGGLYVKWILSWRTLKLPLSATCTWSYLRGYRFLREIQRNYVLNLLKNIYGQKQAGHVWNKYLVDKLSLIRFKASLINNCVFQQDDIIFMAIFLSKEDTQLKKSFIRFKRQGSTSKTKGIRLTILTSTSRRCMMGPTSSHSMHLLML